MQSRQGGESRSRFPSTLRLCTVVHLERSRAARLHEFSWHFPYIPQADNSTKTLKLEECTRVAPQASPSLRPGCCGSRKDPDAERRYLRPRPPRHWTNRDTKLFRGEGAYGPRWSSPWGIPKLGQSSPGAAASIPSVASVHCDPTPSTLAWLI